MNTIHKVAAIVIKDDAFLMVRKKGKDTWTNLGGHIEAGETEKEALLREIQEEMGCEGVILRKLGDFEAPAAHDDAIVRLSCYLVELKGTIDFQDPELEEYRYITKNYREKGIQLPPSITEQVIPYLIKNSLLSW